MKLNANKRYLISFLVLLLCSCKTEQKKVLEKGEITKTQEAVAKSVAVLSEGQNLQSFEEVTVPSYLSHDKESKLAASKKVFQHGKQSLFWQGDEDSYIQINTESPRLAVPEKIKELRLWIYSEAPGGLLQIKAGDPTQFDQANGTYQQIDYHLNFKGWRSLWVQFDKLGTFLKDGQLVKREEFGDNQISALRFQAQNKKSKALYFDNLEVTDAPIPHGCLGNLQLPEIVNTLENRHNFPWVALDVKRNDKEYKGFSYEEKELEQIMERIKAVLKTGIGNKHKAKRAYDAFVKQVWIGDQGKTHGPGIYSHIVERYYRLKGFAGIHSQNMNGALMYCADKFLETGDDQWRKTYLSYLDFRSEKGYQYGSATMNRVFEAKNAANYLDSLIKMKDYLGDERLRREAEEIKWMCGYNYLYSTEKEPVDADKMLGDMQTLIVAIYLQPQRTSEEKKSKMYDFTKFQELIKLSMIPGIKSEQRSYIVKPDYSIWHHGMEMVYSYGYAAAHRYMKYYYILHGTQAQLNPAMADGIVNFYADLFTSKGSGSYMGSRGNGIGGINQYSEILAYAAMCQVKNAKKILKSYLHTQAFNLDDLPLETQDFIRDQVLNNQSSNSYPIAQGTHVRAFAATLVHHGKNYTATMRGFNETVSTAEIFLGRENAANIYGQQQNNGFLQIYTPDGPVQSGLELNGGGWDWSLYPGATTLKLTTDEIENDLTHGKFTFERPTLSGGLAHFNKHGLYYQELYGKEKFALESLRGHKSWFFFDGLIVCLGSGISVSGTQAPLVTNLFQYHHHRKRPNLLFKTYSKEGEEIHKGEFPEKVLKEKEITISDPGGNSYYLKSSSSLHIKQGLQKSRVPRFKNPITEGYVSTAWLNHGVNPSNAEYEYAITPQQDLEESSKFDDRTSYQVLQKDAKAHIVTHPGSKTIAYVILEAGSIDKGPLVGSENPVLAMFSKQGEELKLTITDPQLQFKANEVANKNRAIHHVLQIKGEWRRVQCINKPNLKIQISKQAGVTELSFDCIDGQSYDLLLFK